MVAHRQVHPGDTDKRQQQQQVRQWSSTTADLGTPAFTVDTNHLCLAPGWAQLSPVGCQCCCWVPEHAAAVEGVVLGGVEVCVVADARRQLHDNLGLHTHTDTYAHICMSHGLAAGGFVSQVAAACLPLHCYRAHTCTAYLWDDGCLPECCIVSEPALGCAEQAG